jgi:hypothetical protein
MKGIVSIFGGFQTKCNHYKLATEIYKKHNFKVDFYEASLFGVGTLIPTLYGKTVKKAVYQMNSYPKTLPKIIHCNSGGFWTGLEVNKHCQTDAFIIESAPFDPYNINDFNNAFNHLFIKRIGMPNITFSQKTLNYLGIPTMEYNQEWFENYENNIKYLRNTTLMIGTKDNLVNPTYLTKFQNQLKEYQRVDFYDGKHHNIGKTDKESYQSTIDNICKKISNNTIR